MDASPSLFFIAATAIPDVEASAKADHLSSILLVLMILLLPSIAVFVGVSFWIVRRIRSLPSIPHSPDVESKFPLDLDLALDAVPKPRPASRKFNTTPREFPMPTSISGDTLITMYGSPNTPSSPIPSIRVISKSPSRDNESLDMDLEKLHNRDSRTGSCADFNPDPTSSRRTSSSSSSSSSGSSHKVSRIRESLKDDDLATFSMADYYNNDEDDNTTTTRTDPDAHSPAAVLAAFSSFGISSFDAPGPNPAPATPFSSPTKTSRL